jgi:hypothetical protein
MHSKNAVPTDILIYNLFILYMEEEGVSLGWNCLSASHGVSVGLRNTKQNGYKTCPFDEMITNCTGIIDCIMDDFEYFCDVKYLELIKDPRNDEHLIYNNKYKFIFNHESPGHANLHIKEHWAKGANHYTMNDYEEFINRYKRRIQNFKDLLNSNKKITFILTRPNTQLCDIIELNKVITHKYPFLNYKFVFLDFDKNIYYFHLQLMKIDENDDEIKRLSI